VRRLLIALLVPLVAAYLGINVVGLHQYQFLNL